MFETPTCKYCGCHNIECLACCSKTGYYFCNGKGDTRQSHILHHLRSMNFNEITLPEENKYHPIPFKCYVCESTNIFDLGFMTNNASFFIVCSSNCRDQLCQIEEGVNKDYFEPLVSDGFINKEVVAIPNPEEYEKIPISRVISVCQEIQETIGIKQESAQSQIKSAKLQYQSVEEFVSIQTEFVENECEETKKVESFQFKNIHLVWKDGFHCQFKSPAKLYQISKPGSYLVFQNGSQNEYDNEYGYISKKHRNFLIDVTFESTSFHLTYTKSDKNNFQVGIQFKSTRFDRQKAALDSYLKSEKCMNKIIKNVLLGNFSELTATSRLKESIQFCEPRSTYFPRFTKVQINRMMTALSQRFTLIEGAPGTGKTTMSAALAYSFVQANIKPVLVCSQTDEAVNVSMLTIAKTGLKVFRYASSMIETFNQKIDKYLTTRNALNNFKDISSYSEIELLNEKERQNIEKVELKTIQESDVICATCNEIGDKKLLTNPAAQFCAIIVDECCSITDSNLLIPLVKNCQHLIMLGDVVGEIKMKLSKVAKSARFDLSLMERLMLIGFKPSLLNVQFRMHPELADYPSKIFYGNFLKTKFNETENKIKSAINWPNQNIPLFFWNVDSNEEKSDDGFSYKNDQELKSISILLNSILSKGEIKEKEIGIISPCIGQKKYLIEKLPDLITKSEKTDVNNIEIGTVEDFQGKEKNFVIMSLVRANKEFDIGTLNQKNNFCVSLTRARFGLVIIGCAETFSKSKMWCRYIQYCKDKNVFVEGDYDCLKVSDFKPLIELDDNYDNDYE